MLKGYDVDNNDVVFQINPSKVEYNYEYSARTGDSSVLGKNMAYLRYAHIIGSIGHIPNSILDVGYGLGDFVDVCSEIIPECYANDITDAWPLPEKVKFTDNIFNRYYEVITFFDALEHFPDIYFLDRLNCSYVCISLPNCHYFNDEWFDEWKHRKPNEHIWHFNETSMQKFMINQGYKLINFSNVEDVIRKGNSNYSNILTGIFRKVS